MIEQISRPARAVVDELTAIEPTDLVARLTLLMVFALRGGVWYGNVPTAILGIAGLLSKRLRRGAALWAALFVVLLVVNSRAWYVVDNHRHLMAYWCLGMAACMTLRDGGRGLRRCAALLLGLCFAFAVLWRVLSPDFLDGTFFHSTLLIDDRFRWIAEIAVGVGPEAAGANRAALAQLVAHDATTTSVQLVDSGTPTELLANVMTWWSLVLEGGLAIAFLAPQVASLHAVRNGLLLLFAATTYLLAPVLGFGWILMVLGLAQCRDDEPRARAAFLFAFVVLPLALVPWGRLVAEHLR